MMWLPIKKTHLNISAVVIILIMANGIGFWFFMRPGLPPNTFGGTVTELTADTVTVVDVHGRTESFLIASSTKTVFGKREAAMGDLRVGGFVMVTTDIPIPHATATKIRVMSTDPFTRGHNQPRP